ncbi:MAG: alpha-ketoacid dehydrogenase subunit beta [Chlamydiae bacterium]|nr:alpha-ketoacid dehydrogenase subunit beta [Chlamydiota bacterium]
MPRELKFFEAIHEAFDLCLAKDPHVYIMGLGVPDPKGIFGTTLGLQEKYGSDRIMDMPTAENGITGVALGSALVGMRPILTHQRIDFAILAMEQMVNQAAKWHYMFGGRASVPLVVRLIVGRGWGQGPQHSQSLQSWFAHIPGLKVVMPVTPYDAKGLLISSIEDNNPVIFIEHRWLHNISGPVPEEMYRVPLGKAKVAREGKDVTVVRKTGRLIVADTSWKSFGASAEIIALVAEKAMNELKCAPKRVALPDVPTPTTPILAKRFYPRAIEMVAAVREMFQRNHLEEEIPASAIHLDIPDPAFRGPF